LWLCHSHPHRAILVSVATLAFFPSLFLLLVEPFTGWLPWMAPHVPALTLGLMSISVFSSSARDRLLSEFRKVAPGPMPPAQPGSP